MFNAIVQIGSQYWMRDNLAVETFQDGTPITEVTSSEQWLECIATETPAWCYYNYDSSLEEEYGKLYNYYVVSSSKEVAPNGWRVPTLADYNTVITFLGGEKLAGFKMKNTKNWQTLDRSNPNGNNQSGYSANPSGFMKHTGEFWDFGWSANYWTSTTASADSAESIRLYWQNKNAINIDALKNMGLAIRLVYATGSYTESFNNNPTIDF
jgi:uncharacterized protein (TIGR02145 family)